MLTKAKSKSGNEILYADKKTARSHSNNCDEDKYHYHTPNLESLAKHYADRGCNKNHRHRTPSNLRCLKYSPYRTKLHFRCLHKNS